MVMIRETVEAKCEVNFPLDRDEADMVNRFGWQELSLVSACVKRGRGAMKKVQRVGRWRPPQDEFIKINTDGSSKGNPGPAGVGGVGRNCRGEVVFLFSVHKGRQSNNLMEGLAILYALERTWELGRRKVICESDSQIIVNLLTEKKVSGIHWQLAGIVQQILQISSLMEQVSFIHIPRECNRAVDCLAKWASEHDNDWKIEGWEHLSQDYCQDLQKIFAEDMDGNDGG